MSVLASRRFAQSHVVARSNVCNVSIKTSWQNMKFALSAWLECRDSTERSKADWASFWSVFSFGQSDSALWRASLSDVDYIPFARLILSTSLSRCRLSSGDSSCPISATFLEILILSGPKVCPLNFPFMGHTYWLSSSQLYDLPGYSSSNARRRTSAGT